MLRTSLLARILLMAAALVVCGTAQELEAREAAFATRGGAVGAATGGDAVVVEPKGEIDTGESVVNVARRTTIFFANKTDAPVEVVNVTTNDDGNVKSSVVSDDCSREHKIGSGSRCSIVVETTPSNPGAWVAEVLLTHKGAGRIARAKLTGRSTGQFSADKKDSGFALSTKEIKPVDFGDIETNGPKVVRTALMVNDSTEAITLLSIDVIAAENGLERLDQGCVVDMELKPGESCPVTLVWKPAAKGLISTDLIIRHSGRLGFAVIPIRGVAHDGGGAGGSQEDAKSAGGKSGKQPTAAQEIEKSLADKIPSLPSNYLESTSSASASGPSSGSSAQAHSAAAAGEFRLIGTVGNRAVLLKPDGTTTVAGIGEEITYGDNKRAKVTNVASRDAEIFVEGKKKQLVLGAAVELTSKASGPAAPFGQKDVPASAPQAPVSTSEVRR